MSRSVRRLALGLGSRLSGMHGVLAVMASMLVVLALLAPGLLRLPAPAGRTEVPGWALLLMFGAVEGCVLHLQVRREAQTVSLHEIPLLIGLFLASPAAVLVARLLGPIPVLVLVRKQPPVKVLFNTILFVSDAAVSLTVFHAFPVHGLDRPLVVWAASLAAVLSAGLFASVATTFVIAASEARLRPGDFWQVPVQDAPRVLAVAVLGLIAVYALADRADAALPLLAAAGVVFVVYRAYAALSERHLSLERLYQFSQVVSSSPEVDEVLRSVLQQAKEMLRGGSAEVTFLGTGEVRGAVRVVLPPAGRLQRHEIDAVATAASVWAQVVESGEPVLLARGSRNPEVQQFLSRLGYRDALLAPLRGEAGVIGTLLVGDRLGDVRTFDEGDVRLLETVANHAGVALQHGRLMDQLRHDALHDALTGLPNRVYLQNEVRSALEQLERGEVQAVAVGLMDLDGFKEVNDTLGHGQGDLLLKEVAIRLTAAAGTASVARLGGDEFAFVLTQGAHDEDGVVRLSRRMLHALEQPVDLGGVDVQVGASLGLSFAPEHAVDASALLKRADLAMYDAKTAGAGVRVYAPSMDTTDPQRLALVGELRQAIEREELEVHVQPKARLGDGLVTGVEALVRWDHPVLGFVPPDTFVPVAERSGLIRPLTMLVLRRTLEACAQWRAAGHEVQVAVNLSARSLVDMDLVEDVGRLLRRYDVPASLLTLEITESSVMTDPGRAMGLLTALQGMGIRLSVDDFGTGYSSLSYLKRLPVHEVKIDRSFVTNVVTDSDDRTIVRSIIDLAGNLSLEVVAEGVEDLASWQALEELGATYVQGYYLSRPMRIPELLPWLRARLAQGDQAVLKAVG